MRTLGKIAALAALPVMLVGFGSNAIADNDKHDRGHWHKQKHWDRGNDRRSQVIVVPSPSTVIVQQAPVYYRSGPPPWAPAHGYRRKHGEAVQYAAPFGIDIGKCYREKVGSVLGGVAGAAIGSQIGQGSGKLVAVAGGTLLGILVGGSIGRSMDQLDYACAGQILEYAPDQRTIIWNNPQTGGSYQMTPVRAYQVEGRYCREYTSTASVGGRAQQVYGTACRQPDGSWQIMS